MVVFGHTYPHFRNYIYLFHVAFFLMISGYLYPANINDFSDWKYYVLRKLKKLYAPYVAINCVFIAATNLFVKINVPQWGQTL